MSSTIVIASRRLQAPVAKRTRRRLLGGTQRGLLLVCVLVVA
jgi:hypothetical protein